MLGKCSTRMYVTMSCLCCGGGGSNPRLNLVHAKQVFYDLSHTSFRFFYLAYSSSSSQIKVVLLQLLPLPSLSEYLGISHSSPL